MPAFFGGAQKERVLQNKLKNNKLGIPAQSNSSHFGEISLRQKTIKLHLKGLLARESETTLKSRLIQQKEK